jgi:hypothetical protein
MSNPANKRRSLRPAPTTETGTVVKFPSPEPARTYLTPDEVDQLASAARDRGRHGHRDATMILLAYRHGLRRARWSFTARNLSLCSGSGTRPKPSGSRMCVGPSMPAGGTSLPAVWCHRGRHESVVATEVGRQYQRR